MKSEKPPINMPSSLIWNLVSFHIVVHLLSVSIDSHTFEESKYSTIDSNIPNERKFMQGSCISQWNRFWQLKKDNSSSIHFPFLDCRSCICRVILTKHKWKFISPQNKYSDPPKKYGAPVIPHDVNTAFQRSMFPSY